MGDVHRPDFTVAIGLEAYDDEVLRFHVNKGSPPNRGTGR